MNIFFIDLILDASNFINVDLVIAIFNATFIFKLFAIIAIIIVSYYSNFIFVADAIEYFTNNFFKS